MNGIFWFMMISSFCAFSLFTFISAIRAKLHSIGNTISTYEYDQVWDWMDDDLYDEGNDNRNNRELVKITA